MRTAVAADAGGKDGKTTLASAFLAISFLLACGCACPVSRVPTPVFSTVIEPPALFVLPVEDAVVPSRSSLLPNSPRAYRGGIHEGVDFYTKNGGEFLACGEAAFSVQDATVIRADLDWPEVGEDEYRKLTTNLKSVHDEVMLDRLRGRQVWLGMNDGTVVRYCHLASVSPMIVPGLRVARGERIGTVGNSGTAEGSRASSLNCHLHFEVWPVATAFLGSGMEPESAAGLYRALFETACRPGRAPREAGAEPAGTDGPEKEAM